MPDRAEASWTDAQLLETSVNYFGIGDDARQLSGVRFLRGVARLVKRRLRSESPLTNASPAIFLLSPRIPPSLAGAELEEYPMLDNGLTAVEGRLWLVGPPVNYGYCMQLTTESDADLFELLISNLDLGDVPAVIFDPRTEKRDLRYYGTGLRDRGRCEIISALFSAVTVNDVFAKIHHVHETKLVTPDGQNSPARLWQDPAKHWPVENAELRIQMYLDTALHVAFPSCRITSEQPGVSGRTDLEVEEIDPATKEIVRHVLLELKVLRDFGSTGRRKSLSENETWILEGIDQAFCYAKEKGFLGYALCCFDMRVEITGEACFAHVRDKAAHLGVQLRCWHLFAAAKDYRRHKTALADESRQTGAD